MHPYKNGHSNKKFIQTHPSITEEPMKYTPSQHLNCGTTVFHGFLHY